MNRVIFRYNFSVDANMDDVESALVLALLATETLHGESRVRLEAAHAMDSDDHTCVIDADTAVGRDLNRLFVGFVRREFGEDTFHVNRVSYGRRE